MGENEHDGMKPPTPSKAAYALIVFVGSPVESRISVCTNGPRVNVAMNRSRVIRLSSLSKAMPIHGAFAVAESVGEPMASAEGCAATLFNSSSVSSLSL